jgi:hypothetical protein
VCVCVCVCVSSAVDHGRPIFKCKWPRTFLWACSRPGRENITISGTSNRTVQFLKYRLIYARGGKMHNTSGTRAAGWRSMT